MKAMSKCFSVVLAAASLLTLAGCKKATPNNRVATTANWNTRTATIVEKNYLDFWQTHKEKAVYSLSFKESGNPKYSVSYDTANAVYSTEFYMESAYDWSSDKLPEDYRKEEKLTEPVYVYETSLTISGAYKVKSSGEEFAFSDVLKSVCKFRLAGENLKPVYSHQIIQNTAPASLGSDSIKDNYVQINQVVETFYNKEFTQSTAYITDKKTENAETVTKKTGLNNGSGYSVFDNSQINAAVRAFTFTGGATRFFNTVIPQDNTLATCKVTIGSPVELNREDEVQRQIVLALENCTPDDYIFFDGAATGEEKNKTIRYNAVALSVVADLTGPTPVSWYSTVENNDVNGTRCVLLRRDTPAAFGLGTLTYALKSLNVETI